MVTQMPQGPDEAPQERRFRLVRWAILISVILILAVSVLGWALRRSIAERALAAWCDARELSCEATFERLGLDGATLSGLKVRSGGGVPLEAAGITAGVDWPGLFTPRVTSVVIDQPVLRGKIQDGKPGLLGLERLARSGSGGASSGALPALEIRGGRIEFATDAGMLTASAALTGRFPENAELRIVVDPASLASEAGQVQWTEGLVDLTARDGRINGIVSVEIEQAAMQGIAIRSASFRATLETDDEAAGPATLVWDGEVPDATWAGMTVEQLKVGGQVQLAPMTEFSREALVAALAGANFELETGKVAGDGIAAGSARLEGSLASDGEGALGGPLRIVLTDALLRDLKVGQVETEGTLAAPPGASLRFEGPVTLTGASLPSDASTPLLKAVNLPSPLSAHGASLRSALGRALAAFDVSAGVTAEYGGGELRVGATDRATLTSSSGLHLDASRAGGQPLFTLSDDALSVTGDLALRGGGAPDLSLEGVDVLRGKDTFSASVSSARIAPWTAGGTAVSATLKDVAMARAADRFDLSATGSAAISGPAFGVTLNQSTLRGGLAVHLKDGAWQAESVGTSCVAFGAQSVSIGAVDAGPVSLDLCPSARGFLRDGKGAPSGTFALGDLDIPFTTKSGSGAFRISKATLAWTSANGFAFTLDGKQSDLPLTIGERTFDLSSQTPQFRLQTRSGAAPALSAELGASRFGGTLVPANVSAKKLSFDGSSGEGGLSGKFNAGGVDIADNRADPIYEPLVGDFAATLNKGQMHMTGPLRLRSNDVVVADTLLDLDILRLDGRARVISRPLDFRRGGLQPVKLSERLRGVFTDASGQFDASADVLIADGKLNGTSDLAISDFSFQTTRLGRVEAVNGNVNFSDIFGLTTTPGQVIEIGSMNPGVPLRDGRIVFQFSEGKVLKVSSAVFPFAGGALALEPFDWTLGGATQHLNVSARDISLASLIETLKLPDTVATGTVAGSFPIDILNTEIRVRDARLKADGQGGRLSYTGKVTDTAAAADPNANLAFEALKDFDFTVLEVGLDGNVADTMTISLIIAGKSRKAIAYGKKRTLLAGQPFEFNIRVTSPLKDLFESASSFASQKGLTNIVVNQVRQDQADRLAAENPEAPPE